jgi:hypothetical protein
VLLFWAQRRPIERADILLITLIPVVTLLAVAAGLVAASGQIPVSTLLPMFIFYCIVYATFIPAFIWAKQQIPRSGGG